MPLTFYQQGDTGVRHDSDAGVAPNVFLISCRGRVVHPDHASDSVYLLSSTSTEHLTRAGDQGTLVAVDVQKLLGKDIQLVMLQEYFNLCPLMKL